MSTGCLLITNNIAASHETEFNAWYQGEHLDDRLGVPGFLSARRYRANASPQRYAAVYETRSPEVLLSPTYAALLRGPSPRTRAIMPYFQDVTRVIGEVVDRQGQGTVGPGHGRGRQRPGAGGALAILFITLPDADAGKARRIAEAAGAVTGQGIAPEAVRAVLVRPDNVGVDTPESKLRPTPDRRADLVLLVEWISAGETELHALKGALGAQGWQVESGRGGLYQLICARQNESGE